MRLLGMREPQFILTERENIHLAVRRYSSVAEKRDALLDAAADASPPGIVYAATLRDAEEVAGALEKRGIDAVFYHGGMNIGKCPNRIRSARPFESRSPCQTSEKPMPPDTPAIILQCLPSSSLSECSCGLSRVRPPQTAVRTKPTVS